MVVENVNDLFSIPLLLQYNPAVISIEDVQHAVSEGQHGGFLSGGTQEIAIVKSVNAEKGQAIISATRQPNTAGRERERHASRNRDQGHRAGLVESVDHAAECQRLAAAAHSVGHQ